MEFNVTDRCILGLRKIAIYAHPELFSGVGFEVLTDKKGIIRLIKGHPESNASKY